MAGGWTVLQTDQFTKQLKQYTRYVEMCKKVDEMVDLLKNEDDPRRIGDRKSGQLKDVYVIKFSKQHRLLYEVVDDKHEVRRHQIGDHKVYRHEK